MCHTVLSGAVSLRTVTPHSLFRSIVRASSLTHSPQARRPPTTDTCIAVPRTSMLAACRWWSCRVTLRSISARTISSSIKHPTNTNDKKTKQEPPAEKQEASRGGLGMRHDGTTTTKPPSRELLTSIVGKVKDAAKMPAAVVPWDSLPLLYTLLERMPSMLATKTNANANATSKPSTTLLQSISQWPMANMPSMLTMIDKQLSSYLGYSPLQAVQKVWTSALPTELAIPFDVLRQVQSRWLKEVSKRAADVPPTISSRLVSRVNRAISALVRIDGCDRPRTPQL